MDLVINYKDKPISILNEVLVNRQKLIQEDVERLKELHVQRMDIEAVMQRARTSKTLKKLFAEWAENQFDLQRTWKFPEDAMYHRFWEVPKCTCPVLDNLDSYPYRRYISGNCPVHGEPNE